MNDVPFDRDLKKALARPSRTPCPGEEALVAFYRGGVSEADADAIRDHLAACASCVELARDARAFVEAMRGADGDVMPMSRAKRWLALAAALAAGAILAISIARSRPAPSLEAVLATPAAPALRSWKDLPITAAPYAPAPEDELLYRSDAPADASDFTEVMAPYVRGNYAAAEAALGRFLQAHPRDARASFYRGVTLLLLGRPEEAEPLLRAAATTGRPFQDARWYLALARLQSGDQAAALADLDAVAAEGGAKALEAARLASEVRSGSSAPPR
jgi:tetratricopeptide (TPR) repeat protein